MPPTSSRRGRPISETCSTFRAAETDTVLASLELEYERAIEADDDVTVALRVADLGNVESADGIRDPRGRVACGDGVYRPSARRLGTGESRPLPTEWRTRIEQREQSSTE